CIDSRAIPEALRAGRTTGFTTRPRSSWSYQPAGYRAAASRPMPTRSWTSPPDLLLPQELGRSEAGEDRARREGRGERRAQHQDREPGELPGRARDAWIEDEERSEHVHEERGHPGADEEPGREPTGRDERHLPEDERLEL